MLKRKRTTSIPAFSSEFVDQIIIDKKCQLVRDAKQINEKLYHVYLKNLRSAEAEFKSKWGEKPIITLY